MGYRGMPVAWLYEGEYLGFAHCFSEADLAEALVSSDILDPLVEMEIDAHRDADGALVDDDDPDVVARLAGLLAAWNAAQVPRAYAPDDPRTDTNFAVVPHDVALAAARAFLESDAVSLSHYRIPAACLRNEWREAEKPFEPLVPCALADRPGRGWVKHTGGWLG